LILAQAILPLGGPGVELRYNQYRYLRMSPRKLNYAQSLGLALCLVVSSSISTNGQSESSLSTRVVEALKAKEPDWKYIGYLEFPFFPRLSSERRVISGIWYKPQERSKDMKISVYSVESRGEAAKWLRPARDEHWHVSAFQIGDEGYSLKHENGDRFAIEFRRGTVVARIEGDDLDRVKEFAQTVVEQIRAN
jgi:hypothetical protein